MTIRTDPELVALTAAGDQGAYGELYRRYLPVARRRAHQLAPCSADAQDLVSDAFVRVLVTIQRGHWPDQFRAYLLTTIRRGAAALYKRRQRCSIVSLYGDGNEILSSIDILALDTDPAEMCDTEPIRRAFRTLPSRWRKALWLSAVEARTPAELASLLNLTPNGAAALTCRARRGLRRAHAEITGGPQALARACPTTQIRHTGVLPCTTPSH